MKQWLQKAGERTRALLRGLAAKDGAPAKTGRAVGRGLSTAGRAVGRGLAAVGKLLGRGLAAVGKLLGRGLSALCGALAALLRRMYSAAAGWLNRHPRLRDFLGRTGAIFALLAAVVLLLSALHAFAAPRLAERGDPWAAARAAALPGATRFDPLAHDTGADALFAVYRGVEQLGYCIELRATGFGGDLALLVATDPEGAVTAVRVARHRETAGVGDRVTDPDFLARFIGLTAPIEGVDTLSGSTISSRAVIDGVRAALAALYEATGRGGGHG